MSALTDAAHSVHSPPPFTGEGQGGGMRQDISVRAHPLPTPPPQAGEGAHRVRGSECTEFASLFRSFPRKRESSSPHERSDMRGIPDSLTLIRATKPWVPAGVHPRESAGGD